MCTLYSSGAFFTAVDTETTGVKSATDRIIEIGAVKFNKDGITGSFSSLINPHQHLNPFITNLTGICDSDLCDAPDVSKVINDFVDFSKGTVLAAHNAQFDLRFINSELERLSLLPLDNQCIDTLRLSRLILPENKTWKQTSLAAQFSIDTGHAHRAYDDANVCRQIFEILIDKIMERPQIKKALQMTAEPSSKQIELDF